MKVKCPWCGTVGTDDKPVPEDIRGPSYTPPKGNYAYAFEVRGNYEGRPVRKCLSCGKGVRVTILPPRFRKVPSREWAELQRLWKQYMADSKARMEQREAERAILDQSDIDE